jgi:hypothetical protein
VRHKTATLLLMSVAWQNIKTDTFGDISLVRTTGHNWSQLGTSISGMNQKGITLTY